MPATEWTVITTPLARSERWAAWISARRGVETPLLALAFAVIRDGIFHLGAAWLSRTAVAPRS
jgi:hypothetical protein